jgi:MerR family copper efflux transcriptional regulator
MTIGQLARTADVGAQTIRFYERQGLLPAPPRTSSGYRQYPRDTLDRLHFILRAKALGFSLKEIDELISLRLDTHSCASDVRAQAADKVRDLDGKIRDLQRMRSRLLELMQACAGRGTLDQCPILTALVRESK